MQGILWATFLSSATSYLASCVLFVAQARRRAVLQVRPRWAPRLLEVGAGLHLLYMVLFSVLDRRCPVYSLHSALGILSLVGVITYAVLSHSRRLEAIGGFVAGLAAVLLVTAHAIADHPAATGNRWLMAVHITANFLGAGILLVAGCASAFYLWSEWRLRRRRSLGQGPKLPPLESLDGVVHRLLWIGVPLLSLGVLTGPVVIHHTESVTAGDHVRAWLSVTSWLALVVVLGLRQFARWRGRRPAYAALAGALGLFLVITLYVVRALFGIG